MKKLLSIILIILILLLTSITRVNAISATAELKASSTSVKPGETFTVILSVNSDKTLAAVGGNENGGRDNDSFAYAYDNKKIELVEQKILCSAMDMNIDEGSRASENICLVGSIASGDVYQWTFKVKSNAESGTTTISITDLLLTDYDDDEFNIPAKTVTVNIANDTPTDPAQPEQPEQPDQPDTPVTPSQPTDSQGQSTLATPGNTEGKTSDTTTAKTILPKAGSTIQYGITGVALVILIVFSVVIIKKLRK